MKQRIAWVLVLVLLLTGCGGGTGPAVEDLDSALLNFPGLEWNMPEADVLDALELTQEDWTPLIDHAESLQRLYRVNGTMTVFGYEAKVYLQFHSHVDGVMGLQYVYILFPDTVDAKTLRTDLETKLGVPDQAAETGEYVNATWSSSDVLGPYFEEACQAFKAAYPDNYAAALERQKDTPAATLSIYSDTQNHYGNYPMEHYETEPLPAEYEDGCMMVFWSTLVPMLQYIDNGGYPLPEG